MCQNSFRKEILPEKLTIDYLYRSVQIQSLPETINFFHVTTQKSLILIDLASPNYALLLDFTFEDMLFLFENVTLVSELMVESRKTQEADRYSFRQPIFYIFFIPHELQDSFLIEITFSKVVRFTWKLVPASLRVLLFLKLVLL